MNDNDNIKQSSNQSYGIAGNTPKGENEENTQVQEKNSNLEMDRLFNYLEIKNSTEKFVIDDENPNIFENSIGKFNYVICVLLKDDTQRGNEMLEKTLDSIYQNLNTLNEIGISSSNTLVCIFVNKITNYYLFNKDDVHNIKEDQNYYFYTTAQKEGYQSSTIYLFTKPKELLDLEALKCYYLYVISKIRMNKQQIFSSVITAGVELKPSGLKSLILSAYDTVKTHGVSVGLVDSNGIGIFSMIEQYERTHFNIYNMNYYGMSSAVPISSLLSTMYIDNNVLSILKKYYSLAHENQTIDYHDYNLGLNLYQNNINIKFYSKEVTGTLFTNELEYTDYQEIWVNRYSGYYGNTFELIRELINMNNFNLFKKIILFFQLIGISIEFIYPSLSSMVIYSIFYEAFNTYDYRVATFFTMLYIFMLLASGMCSLVTKKPEEMKMTNMFIFFFMEVYYLFILICSVVAMNNVKKNTSNNEYKFNNAAISCIIVFTFLPYIVPMLLNIEKITSNLLNMLAYIGLGAPSSTSNLLMAQVWNASDTSGGKEIDERKSMALLFFFLFNLFFGSLTFYNYNRRKRVECVMGFGIFYLFYNFFKTIGIVMKILGSSDDANDPNKNGRVIDGIKNSLGKDDDNDMRSEEKKLNNVNYSNDYNNNSNDNNNNNVENDDNDNGDY
jgi:hypothetical protein